MNLSTATPILSLSKQQSRNETSMIRTLESVLRRSSSSLMFLFRDEPERKVAVLGAAGGIGQPLVSHDLFNINAGIVKSLCIAIAKYCPNAFVNMISNTVFSMCQLLLKFSTRLGQYNEKKLFGVTTLDVVRAKVPVADVNIPVVGEWWSRRNYFRQHQEAVICQTDGEITALTEQTQDGGGTEVMGAKAGEGNATLSMV